MNLNEPKVGPSVSKTILKVNEKPESKLGLPMITIRGQIIPQLESPRWLRKMVSYMSNNGPPRSYYGA